MGKSHIYASDRQECKIMHKTNQHNLAYHDFERVAVTLCNSHTVYMHDMQNFHQIFLRVSV